MMIKMKVCCSAHIFWNCVFTVVSLKCAPIVLPLWQTNYHCFCFFLILFAYLDLGRMYNLVARIPDGLGQLRTLLENHITNQGLNALEKCGDQAFNVSLSRVIYWGSSLSLGTTSELQSIVLRKGHFPDCG